MSGHKCGRPFLGGGISKDECYNTLKASKTMIMPRICSTDPPPSPNKCGGGIAYDKIGDTLSFNNGTIWQPVAVAGRLEGTVISYSFIKGSDSAGSAGLPGEPPLGVQVIPPNTSTIIQNWSMNPSPPYHTFADLGYWDLPSGVYVATHNHQISIGAEISWGPIVGAPGGWTFGRRVTRVILVDVSAGQTIGAGSVVKETDTQADPNAAEETNQILYTHLTLDEGDMVYIEVEHNNVLRPEQYITLGNHTSIAGFRIRTCSCALTPTVPVPVVIP